MQLLKVLAIAYLIGINIFGFTLLRIQKKEAIFETPAKEPSAKPGSEPTSQPSEMKQEAPQALSGEMPHMPTEQQERLSTEENTPAAQPTAEHKIPEEDLSKEQVKRELKKDKSKRRVRDLTILFISAIGGAIAVYIGMFMMRYKLKNMLLMIFNPVFIGLHAYLIVYLFQNYVVVA